MSNDKDKLNSQRMAVQEHIEKYKEYSHRSPEAVNMALRTILNCQNQIEKILSKHPHWESSWEDTWKPS